MELFIGLSLFPWFLFLYYTHKSYRHLLPLERFQAKDNTSSLSIVIATKDSEEDIEATLRKLVENDYPNLQIIAVNDRSTDDTGKVIERMAQNFSQITPVHIEELPSGWLGKVNALSQGVKKATGEFILFMDGDVLIGDHQLEQAVGIMKEKRLDHLSLMPNIPCSTLALKLLVLTSQLLFTLSNRSWLSIEKRPLKCVKGIGPFNMVRRSSFEKTEGFEWLKLDISDDVALSHLMAKDGGRSLYVKANSNGPTFPWYRDAIHMMHGLEKNIVGGFTSYKISQLILVSTFASLPVLIPLLALLQASSLSFFLFFLYLLSCGLFALSVRDYMTFKARTIALFPLGIMQLNLVMLRAAFLCYQNGGITWSGTFYALEDLRKGLRVRLGL